VDSIAESVTRLGIGIIGSDAVLKVTKRSINHRRFNGAIGDALWRLLISSVASFFFHDSSRDDDDDDDGSETLTLADSAAPHVAQLSGDYLYCVPRYHVQREKSILRWPFDQRLSVGCISRRG